MPRVTVVIPTYNYAEVLPYAIGSVLDQTFTDFELLVVGDCCTDDSAAVVAGFDDPRVSWLNLPVASRHQYGPNNEAIRRSDSDLIAYLGHDDLWLPHHLSALTDALAGKVGISHSSCLRIEPGRPPRARPSGQWAYRRGRWMAPTSVLHSRSLADAVGGWRPPWETGLWDPESDLWARMSTAARHPPIWVRDVTAVKLPAWVRPDVYRLRPHDEQAVWLARIRSGETWTSLVDEAQENLPWQRWTDSAPAAIRWAAQHLGRESWRRRLHRPSRSIYTTAEEQWLANRRRKGLDSES